MAGHRPWKEVRAALPADSQKRIREGAARILAEIELTELRQHLQLTQQEMAKKMEVTQAAISQLEKRGADPQMQLGTLANYIRALGGELQLSAVVGDRTFHLTHVARGFAGTAVAGRQFVGKAKAGPASKKQKRKIA